MCVPCNRVVGLVEARDRPQVVCSAAFHLGQVRLQNVKMKKKKEKKKEEKKKRKTTTIELPECQERRGAKAICPALRVSPEGLLKVERRVFRCSGV